MKKNTHYYLWIIFLLLLNSATGQTGEGKILEDPICIFIPIEKDQNLHIPQPEVKKTRITPTAEFIVNYPDDIDTEAKEAFAHAVEIWSYQIASTVPIEINFSFSDLGGSILGSAGPKSLRRNFVGAPSSNTWYPIALANKLAGFDLDESIADITISFNSEANWYFGIDGNTTSGKYDFVSVVLHELGHGLGFTGSGSSDGTNGSYGKLSSNYIYDGLVVNSSNERVEDFSSPSTDFHDYLTSNDLYIDGAETVSANGDTPARLYAPSTFDAGSSYAHWNESTYNGTTNALMTPQIGSAESIHDVGDITRALFKDMGWETKPNNDLTPFNLKASGVSESRIDLSWSDNSDTETGFVIFRSTSEDSGFEEVDTVNADILVFNDLSVESGNSYYYQITALDEDGNYSDESDIVQANACSSPLPTNGTWTGSGSSTAFGGTITSSNSSITITSLEDNAYLFSDITGGLYAELGSFEADQSYTISNECSEYTIGENNGSGFTIITSDSEGFGAGSYDEETETLTLPWYDSGNDFGATTVFTRNNDSGLESPTINAAQITFDQVAAHSMKISWTNGNGENRLVLARETEPIDVTELPEENINYTVPSNDYSEASTSIGDCRVVYNGSDNSFILTGLTENTHYFFYVFEYNQDTDEYTYLNTRPAANSQTTLDAFVWTGADGDGDWNNASNWQDGVIPSAENHVVITADGTSPEIDEDAAVYNLEISKDAAITIHSGGALAIFGSVANYGTYTVKRNTTGNNGYSIIGTPVISKTISDLGASHVYSNNGTDYSSNLKDEDSVLEPGKGYFAAFNSTSPSISFTGTPNTGYITYSADNGDFELVANPYSAAISIENFLSDNSSVISGAVYFWDDGGANINTKRGGDFITTNGLGTVSITQPDGTNDGIDGNKGEDPAENGFIPSVQGIFVEAISDGEIIFTPDQQVTSTEANSDEHYYRKGESSRTIVKLGIKENDFYNELLFGLTPDATEGRDRLFDAKKIDTDYPISFYSYINQEKYVIQGLPLIEEGSTSSILEIAGLTNDSFKLTVEKFEGIPAEMTVLMRDLTTEIEYILSESSEFIFQTESSIRQFELTFTYLNVLSTPKPSDLQVLANGDELWIQYPSEGEHMISIYTLDGKLSFQKTVSFENGKGIIQPQLTTNQAYILIVNDESKKFIIKR